MNLPLWWVRSESEEGSNCYAAAFSSAALRMAAADFGYEDADDLEDLTVSPVTADDVGRLQVTIAELRTEIADAREAARWRPLTEPAPEGEEVEVCVVAISFTHGEYTIPTLGTFVDGDWDHAAPRGRVYAWRPRQPVPTPPKGES